MWKNLKIHDNIIIVIARKKSIRFAEMLNVMKFKQF